MDEELVRRAADAVRAAWDEGCPAAGGDPQEIARIAVRRWNSCARRVDGVVTWEQRVNDLTKGLIARWERDPHHVGPEKVDYHYLAEMIAIALRGENELT